MPVKPRVGRGPYPIAAGAARRATCLFVDIGGVLLTNGWEHQSRQRAAAHFRLNLADLEERHRTVFTTYEEGRMTLTDYLSLVIFYRKRAFTRDQFRRFMFAESAAYPDMLELVTRLKDRYRLKVVAVSNEARELNEHRIRTFRLDHVVDAFVSSCFVHLRKPDVDIFRLALDIAHTNADRVVYIENTGLFVEIAAGLGIRGVLHRNTRTTRKALERLGLPDQSADAAPSDARAHDRRWVGRGR
jgi:putative hydrolase of the HAD superfamily